MLPLREAIHLHRNEADHKGLHEHYPDQDDDHGEGPVAEDGP